MSRVWIQIPYSYLIIRYTSRSRFVSSFDQMEKQAGYILAISDTVSKFNAVMDCQFSIWLCIISSHNEGIYALFLGFYYLVFCQWPPIYFLLSEY